MDGTCFLSSSPCLPTGQLYVSGSPLILSGINSMTGEKQELGYAKKTIFFLNLCGNIWILKFWFVIANDSQEHFFMPPFP